MGMGCILMGVLVWAELSIIMNAGINLESTIAVLCLAVFPALLFYGFSPEINKTLKKIVRVIAILPMAYFLLFSVAVLMINAKYQSETRNYINNHPEYVWSTIKEGVLNYFYL